MLNDLEEMLAVYSEWEKEEQSWQESLGDYLEEVEMWSVKVPRTDFIKEGVWVKHKQNRFRLVKNS